MKIGIIGGRDFNNFEVLERKCLKFLPDCTVVSGGAKGADTLAERFADRHLLEKIIHKAEWNKYGKQAGFIRNKSIVQDADIIIAFWDGKSKGTKNSIDMAKKINKPCYVYDYDGFSDEYLQKW